MGRDSAIAWTHHTFNPWWGCTKVSPGCTNCYAEAWDKRTGGNHWRGAHRFFGEKHWREPLKWNRDAKELGVRRRVFCASMADVFEDAPGLKEQRARLWKLIEATPYLDWLLLTKRPENARGMSGWLKRWPDHVWFGVSVESQEFIEARVACILNDVPARVRFVSAEPLLGPLDFTVRDGGLDDAQARAACGLRPYLDWIIVGGESGPSARPCNVAWIRSIVAQCRAAGTTVFVKQMGAMPACDIDELDRWPFTSRAKIAFVRGDVFEVLDLHDAKGSDPSEWPEDLRVQEFPT